jgi:hypothetical protein
LHNVFHKDNDDTVMAKENSIFNIRGTLGGVTHVKSKTYGKHVRAARGTHKVAEVNDVMKQSGKHLVSANQSAKLIKDALNPYRQDFKDGTLWSRLVSLFKKQIAARATPDFLALKGFEIHKEHSFTRIAGLKAEYAYDLTHNTLSIELRISDIDFSRMKQLDHHQLKVITLFPDVQQNQCATHVHDLPLTSNTSVPNEVNIVVPVPAEAKLALVCVKIEGAEKQHLSNSHKAKGMQVLMAVEVGNQAQTKRDNT